MENNLIFEAKDPRPDETSKEKSTFVFERRYLKPFVPSTRDNLAPVPLGLRRSKSLEDTSNDSKLNFIEKSKQDKFPNPSLPNSASLKSLCLRLRPYQLLPEFNQLIEESDYQHQFDWWNTIDHLRPFLEKIILDNKLINHFQEDRHQQRDENLIKFKQSNRYKRRNAICFAVDRLYYNQQLILFVAITNELQVEYNLMSSGFAV